MRLAYPTLASERRRTRGFSLVETLVALIVICIGLLGIAKMQALALSNMTTSRMRALAAFEAAGLAAAMHSNRDYWANTPLPANFTVTVNPATAPFVTSTDPGGALGAQASVDYQDGPGAANGAPGLNACVGTAASGAVCATPMNLAAYDLARWAYSLGGAGVGLLPNPLAIINCPNLAAPVTCTIKISWTEQAVAINQQEAAVNAAACTSLNGAIQGNCFENPTYLLYVEP